MNSSLLEITPHPLKWALSRGLLSNCRFQGLHPWLAIDGPYEVEQLQFYDVTDAETKYVCFAGKFNDPYWPTSATESAFFDESGQTVFVMCKTGHMRDFWKITNMFPSFWDWYRWAINDAIEWQELGAQADEVAKGKAQ